jgi:drug/metabolite transporter (DMT)-like permease
VVLSLRFASPAICTLILGISPITIAFYGNWKQKECSYRSLLLPSLMILLGLILVNTPAIGMRESVFEYALGLICCAVSLAAWSWYAVANSLFLKTNPQVASGDWATLIGVSTLVWVAVFGVATMLFFGEQWDGGKYFVWDAPFIRFLIGGAILGLLCSWVGGFLWNRASTYLPVALVGQMTIFETIFGLIFVYMLEQRFPPQLEALGVLILFSAVLLGIRYQQQEAERSLKTAG